MLKKVLIISSSPRENGNSDTLCDEFLRGAADAGNNTEKIFLRSKKINYCTGCGYCTRNDYNGCIQKDDVNETVDKMIEADVIVMATPVYFYTMCGQMKTFLDRCSSKFTKIKDKDFYFIMTAADEEQHALEKTLDGFRGFLDCLENVREKGAIYATGLWHKNEVNNTKFRQEAYLAGKNV